MNNIPVYLYERYTGNEQYTGIPVSTVYEQWTVYRYTYMSGIRVMNNIPVYLYERYTSNEQYTGIPV